MNFRNKLGNFKYFDPKMGIGGGLFLAIIVFFINIDHGTTNAITAASKQGVYTFLAGGTMMRIAENLAVKFENQTVSISLAVGITSLLAVGFTYIVHSAKGTPEPLNSTIPTMIFAPPGFLWWTVRKRRQFNSDRD
jgi:hypothetical protein